MVKLRRLKEQYRSITTHRYVHVALVALVSSVLTFPLSSAALSDRAVINEMFRNEDILGQAWSEGGAGGAGVFLNMLLFVCVKFVVTLLPCAVPLSCGIFTPIFALGAVVGRLVGEALQSIFPHSSIFPATYAVVGAASLTAASTHTVSTAVIVFELTGQLSHMLPVMLAVLVAYSIGATFSGSIYDVLSEMAGIQTLAPISELQLDGRTAASCMVRNVPFLTLHSTYHEAAEMIRTDATECFAVCDEAILIAAVARRDIERALARLAEARDATDTEANNDALCGSNTDDGKEPFLVKVAAADLALSVDEEKTGRIRSTPESPPSEYALASTVRDVRTNRLPVGRIRSD